MHILIAADKFKDSLPAVDVVRAMESGLQKACPDAQIVAIPMADGGEGSLEVWLALEHGSAVTVEVMDPLYRPIKARYGLSPDKKTAFVEMAQASGLERLLPKERRCWETSSVGTGQLIKHAIERGAERVIIAAGGSATVDGGIGMAEALGFHFLNDRGRLVPAMGGQLSQIQTYETRKVHPRVASVDFEVWTDVTNPLYGPNGAAFMFARQKGASEEQIKLLDKGLRDLEKVCHAQNGKISGDLPGAGAAGGLAFGALSFLKARLLSGVAQFLSYPILEEAFDRADLVVTGEGRLDHQTRSGKLIHGICQKALQHHLPVIALCGAVEVTPEEMADMGLLAAFSITRKPGTLTEILPRTRDDLEEASPARNVGRMIYYAK
ncbi:MAG: glycerate kinase [Saprospirales bacterium]|nr:glycerate kinase [Saprospirales bacterium]